MGTERSAGLFMLLYRNIYTLYNIQVKERYNRRQYNGVEYCYRIAFPFPAAESEVQRSYKETRRNRQKQRVQTKI